MGEFYENVSSRFMFGQIRIKMTDTLNEDLYAFLSASTAEIVTYSTGRKMR